MIVNCANREIKENNNNNALGCKGPEYYIKQYIISCSMSDLCGHNSDFNSNCDKWAKTDKQHSRWIPGSHSIIPLFSQISLQILSHISSATCKYTQLQQDQWYCPCIGWLFQVNWIDLKDINNIVWHGSLNISLPQLLWLSW